MSYNLMREMKVNFENKDNGIAAVISGHFCDNAEFPYVPEKNVADMKTDFLQKLYNRTKIIIECLEAKNQDSFVLWCEKNNLNVNDPKANELFKEEQKFLSDMDIIFDDAENFLRMYENKNAKPLAYSIYENDEKEVALGIAYRNDEVAGAVDLKDNKNKAIMDKLIDACKTQSKKDFDNVVNIMNKACPELKEKAFEMACYLNEIENEAMEKPCEMKM